MAVVLLHILGLKAGSAEQFFLNVCVCVGGGGGVTSPLQLKWGGGGLVDSKNG